MRRTETSEQANPDRRRLSGAAVTDSLTGDTMMNRRTLIGAAAASAAVPLLNRVASAQTPMKTKNVVFVHGLFADGSSWSKVIARLQKKGINCTSVQNPLTSLDEASEAARRGIALQPGPTVLVGHSFSGMIVTEVGVDPKVTALVYVAARAPDAGEDYAALAKKYPTPPASAGVVFNDDWGQLSEEAFLHDFAGDLPREEALVLYAVQQPFKKSLNTDKTTNAAWRTKPSFYAVSTQDRTINPDLERFMAKRMDANTIEIELEPPVADLTPRCDHEPDSGGARRLSRRARKLTTIAEWNKHK